MKSVRRSWTLCHLLPLWLGAVTAGAVTPTDNPYLGLTNRNAFGIRPPAPPPPQEVVAPPPAAPPNVFLTGVSNTGGQKKAYLAINRPGKNSEYETVVEGDELDDLKVLEIDAKAATVRTLIGGREVSLNFKDNGLKSAGGAPVPGAPARPGAVPTPVAPVPTQAAQANSGGPVIIGRGGVNLSGGNQGGFQGGIQSGNQGFAPAPAAGANYSSGNLTESAGSQNVRPLPVRPGSDSAPIQNVNQPTDSSGRIPLPIPPPSRFTQ